MSKPKTENLAAYIDALGGPVMINVHEGKGLETAQQIKNLLERATPGEIALLDKLFSNPVKKAMAISMAAKYLK